MDLEQKAIEQIRMASEMSIQFYEQPFVEDWGERLCGVLEIKSSETLSEQGLIYLQEEWRGQLTDGWGEGVSQTKGY